MMKAYLNIHLKNWLSLLIPKQLGIQVVVAVATLFIVTFGIFSVHIASEEANRSTTHLHKLALELSIIIASTSAHFLLNKNYHALESMLVQAAKFPDLKALQIVDMHGKVIADVIQVDGQDPTVRYGQPDIDMAMTLPCISTI